VIGHAMKQSPGCGHMTKPMGEQYRDYPIRPYPMWRSLIGRAVSGVYAKVMSFRSLDPRVPGEGMSGAAAPIGWFGLNFLTDQAIFFGRTN
jgi:hypothetical protein